MEQRSNTSATMPWMRAIISTRSEPKAQFHNNQYGGSLGGPIIKNKTFFYADYEGQQEPVGVVTLACVPVRRDWAKRRVDSSSSIGHAIR